jgi:hypothetical protein
VNHPPEAVLSGIQSVYKRDIVTLDGSRSSDQDQDPLTYQWTQISGPAVVLNGAMTAKPSFIAPSATSSLSFSLIVNDGKVNSTSGSTSVLVQNRAPIAFAPSSLAVATNSSLILDATGSSDPDGDPIGCTWVQTGGPLVSLQSLSSYKATCITPGSPAVLTFSLMANDGETNSQPVTVTVNVQTTANGVPIVYAGSSQSVFRQSRVTLSGIGTDPDGDPLTYQWTQVSGTSVTLQNPTSPSTSFTAPGVDGDLVFSLTASDGKALSIPSNVTVHVVDRRPTVTSVQISPAAPKRNDPVRAVVVASDPDGDPLSYAYSWTRNGVPVAGATDATYPPGNQVKGDALGVNVTVSDGTLSASAGTQTLIVDSPAVLSSNAPTAATYGQAVTFQVSATDPDGDSTGTFEVDYGPAGFKVDELGSVTWTPSGPMFDRSLDLNWAVRLKGDPAARLTGTIALADPTREYPLVRSNMGIPTNGNCIEISDFDGDGSNSVLIGSNTLYLLKKAGTDYAQTWVYPFDPGMSTTISALAIGDATGDGRREIYFASGTLITALDGVTRREIARFGQDLSALTGPKALITWKALRAADLDGDGHLELVCLGGEGSYGSTDWLYVLDGKTLAIKWKISQTGLGGSMAVANVDADAALEIITAGGYVYDGVTHANDWAYGAGFGFTVDAGDVDGDGIAEIVGAVDWTAVKVYSAVLKSPIWEIPTSDIDSIKVVNLDGASPAEIVVGDGQWGNVTVYRYDSASKAVVKVGQINSQDHGVSGIAAGDVDGDGQLDLVWGSGRSSSGADVLVVTSWGPTPTLKWKGPSPQLDGPFSGAKPARLTSGQTKLIFATPQTASGYNGMRILSLHPTTGALAVSSEVDSNWSRVSACDVGDVFGTGFDRVLLGSANYYDNYFAVMNVESNQKDWVSAKLGAASAITHADMNGDAIQDLIGLTSDGYIYAWDVAHQTLIWSSTSLGSGKDLGVADLDGDGVPEIVGLTGSNVITFAKSQATGTWLETGRYALSGQDLLLADTDGDGKPEIFVLGVATTGGALKVFKLDGRLQLLHSFAAYNLAGIYLEASDFPRKNLLATLSTGSYSTPTPPRIVALDPNTGALVWQSPALLGTTPLNSLETIDLNKDGKRRISFGTSKGMCVTR